VLALTITLAELGGAVAGLGLLFTVLHSWRKRELVRPKVSISLRGMEIKKPLLPHFQYPADICLLVAPSEEGYPILLNQEITIRNRSTVSILSPEIRIFCPREVSLHGIFFGASLVGQHSESDVDGNMIMRVADGVAYTRFAMDRIGPRDCIHVPATFVMHKAMPYEGYPELPYGRFANNPNLVAMIPVRIECVGDNLPRCSQTFAIGLLHAETMEQVAEALAKLAVDAWEGLRPQPGRYFILPILPPWKRRQLFQRHLALVHRQKLRLGRIRHAKGELVAYIGDTLSSDLSSYRVDLPPWGMFNPSFELFLWAKTGIRRPVRTAEGHQPGA